MVSAGRSPTARVLVVDDNAANRELARSTLEDEDYQVVLASSGDEGLAAFEREQPDCVLLDVRMPGLDGFEVCRRLRGLPGGAETPVLFFTALRDLDTFDRAVQAGGDDFLTKPIMPTELVVRVQSALKLRRLGAELRDHFELLKQQRDHLVRVQLQKERLMAYVVHDLKNPVNSMDLNAQALLRQKDLPERARGGLLRIRADAQQLQRMILNLLDVSKAEEGQLAPRRSAVAVKKLLEEVVAENRPSAEARRVSFRIEAGVEQLHADEELLRRVLSNLVENAIRHAPDDSAVALTVAPCEVGTELRVADAGAGIPEELRARIFDPFVQAEAAARPYRQGRGLGLTFCRFAVEAHGGTIQVEDAHPGAVFVVRLPHGE